MATHSLTNRMRRDWSKIRAMSLRTLVLYMAGIGALAGCFAWLLVFALGALFNFDGPSSLALLLAIPRGALYGVILAFLLRGYRAYRSKQSIK